MLAALATLSSLTSVVAPAHAETAHPGPRQRVATAQALFDEGLRLMDAGRTSDACPKFLASEQAEPKSGTLLNLANCYEKNLQSASAWATYTEAAVLGDREGRSEYAGLARRRALAIAPTLLRLTIRVAPQSAEGLLISRDGVAVARGEWELAIPIDPGKHVIVARSPAKVSWTTMVVLDAKTPRIEVVVPPLKSVAVVAEETTISPDIG